MTERTKPMTRRAAKRRARELLADEIQGLDEQGAGYLQTEPQEVLDVWQETVNEAVHKIRPR